MLEPPGGGSVSNTDYEILGSIATFQVNDDNTTTPIQQMTVRSLRFDVVFTFNVLRSTFLAQGAANLAVARTDAVNAICALTTVAGARGAQDIDANDRLYNYLVVVVGDPGGTVTTEVQFRMDHLSDPSTFQGISDAYAAIQAAGPIGSPVV